MRFARSGLVSLLALLLAAGMAAAQTPFGEKATAPTTATPGKETPGNAAPETRATPAGKQEDRMRFHLMDDSIVSGRLAQDELVVETKYGKLTVPIDALVGLIPGMSSHPALEKNLDQLIRDLGNDDFSTRELAQKTLLGMGLVARKSLLRHKSDPDPERRKRVEFLLTSLDEEDEEDDDSPDEPQKELIDLDTVETADFKIVGKIVSQSFTIQSSYGPLQVKLSDIRRAERKSEGPEQIRRKFTINGSNLTPIGFHDTKVHLDRGDRVVISAQGTLTMTPWGGRAISTPEGAPNFGWYIANQIPNGALCAKIGTRGTVFKVGSSYRFTAEHGGVLYLAIGIQNNFANQQFPGQYNVKLKVDRK